MFILLSRCDTAANRRDEADARERDAARPESNAW